MAVLNRTRARAAAVAALAGDAAGWSGSAPGETLAALAGLVVNATPVGMRARRRRGPCRRGLVVLPALLHRGQVVADLIYVPRPTPWLAAAAAAGAATVDGLGMWPKRPPNSSCGGLAASVQLMWRAAITAADGAGGT